MSLSSMPTALSDNDYVIVGLAHCFTKQDGNVVPVKILEPIPSAYFEALLKGVPTSYKALYGLKLGEIVQDAQPIKPSSNIATDDDVAFCESFAERAKAAARTYQSREDLQKSVPYGQSYEGVNFSTEKKRILNSTHQVTAEDNVKQHKYTHMTL
ncbi:hypothetical protein [Leptothoe kymatousa]|uniref:Uncharacterized protein n=1 Tax=Leptothoe kymatousa TAU-MAC 1615 TaxID=2364775 RepID=A0ABS5Y7F6_9CYAN|nr:hypothetical protein [Leptothoe kymatousa]MBT9313758.1 hypothetical protein [Leptothoe kymatousa TAU-MAC 1615]